MKHIYYINGKQVSGNQYYGTIYNDGVHNYMMERCIRYYKKNPDEFETIASKCIFQELLFDMLWDAWKKTPDYEISKKKAESTNKGCLFIALCSPFIVSLILLIWFLATS